MPSPKTPQKVLEELHVASQKAASSANGGGLFFTDSETKGLDANFRSSMQSLLLHVMGEMPKKNQRIATNGIDPDKGEIRDCLSAGYNSAITDCLAVIQSTIDSIKE